MKKKTFFKNPRNKNNTDSRYKKPVWMQPVPEQKKEEDIRDLTRTINLEIAIEGKRTVKMFAQEIIRAAATRKACAQTAKDIRWIGTFCMGFIICVVSMFVASAILNQCESVADKDNHERIVFGTGIAAICVCAMWHIIKDCINDVEIRRCNKEIAKYQQEISQSDADIKTFQQMLKKQKAR